ncbi:MAG: rhomboid family intramembrane serine protease [Chitinophagales bacterium]
MTQYGFTRFNVLPPVIKNLLIINGLVFLAQLTFPALGNKLALYYPSSDEFQPYQFVTHMFAHGSLAHIFFNMFSLWMFGSALENVWGPKRFLTFYLACGLGAAVLYTGVHAIQLQQITGEFFPSVNDGMIQGDFTQKQIDTLGGIFAGTVGASGAVYGLLLAFGMLFPNTLLYIYFLFPIKAKYVVIILTALELYLGFLNNPNDNIAHFAHLGGMLIGFILLKFWGRKRNRFY